MPVTRRTGSRRTRPPTPLRLARLRDSSAERSSPPARTTTAIITDRAIMAGRGIMVGHAIMAAHGLMAATGATDADRPARSLGGTPKRSAGRIDGLGGLGMSVTAFHVPAASRLRAISVAMLLG